MLPQGFCRDRLSGVRLGSLTSEQKSAEGVLGHDVGKVSEPLRMPKGGATDRPSRQPSQHESMDEEVGERENLKAAFGGEGQSR
jgi:hypothetical protein